MGTEGDSEFIWLVLNDPVRQTSTKNLDIKFFSSGSHLGALHCGKKTVRLVWNDPVRFQPAKKTIIDRAVATEGIDRSTSGS